MAHLIDKDALVAEINRYKHKADERLKIKGRTLAEDIKDSALQNLCGNLLHFINSLEVKEVDLEKELDEWMKYGPHTNYPWCTIPDAIKITAEHFFELGLKAQKGE